jgi:hypothetical protein
MNGILFFQESHFISKTYQYFYFKFYRLIMSGIIFLAIRFI